MSVQDKSGFQSSWMTGAQPGLSDRPAEASDSVGLVGWMVES